MKRELLFSHLKFGAEGNQGLTYVCSEENPLIIKNEMRSFGIDVDQLVHRNRLTINNYDRIYIVGGKVNVPAIIESFANMSSAYARNGLEGMRAAAEMSCFFKHNMVKELIDYEYAMHRRLSIPAEGICAYNVRELTERNQLGIVMDLVRAHDPVLFTGPMGNLLLKPEKVKKEDIEKTMQIRIRTTSF
jgi:hypothetical protein